MPRKSKQKTLSGASAGPPRTPVDTTYGEGERAIEAQRRTPVPMTAGTNVPGPVAGAGGGGVGPTPDPHAAALEAAKAMAPPTSALAAPTMRPNEAVQTGMGAQPPLVTPDPALYELQALADFYRYPDLVRFVQRRMMEA